MKGKTGTSMGSVEFRPRRNRPLTPLQRSILGEVRRMPGSTVKDVLARPWCRSRPSSVWLAASGLVERGCIRIGDGGRLYAERCE